MAGNSNWNRSFCHCLSWTEKSPALHIGFNEHSKYILMSVCRDHRKNTMNILT